MDPNQYQMGRSKLFIKDPASVGVNILFYLSQGGEDGVILSGS